MNKILLFFFFISCTLSAFSQIRESDSTYIDSLGYYEEEDYYEVDDEYEADDYEEYNSSYLGEINLLFGVPNAQMRSKFNKSFIGFDIGLYKQFNKTVPLYIGGGFFMVGYDSKSISYFDYSQEDGVEYEFAEEFKGNILGFNVGSKYFSTKSFWAFNPYVQLNLEYRRAFASINNINVDLDETINTDFEGGNSSFGYDIGLGSIVKVKSDKFYFNFKVSYSSGGGLFLYKRNNTSSAIYVVDYFDKKYFPINYVKFNFGITFL